MGRRILRALAWLIGLLCLAVLGLSLGIHADQYLLRRRAERLQSDIRSLDLRKSAYADARKVIEGWWGGAREQGPCRPDWCDVEITLNRNVPRLWSYPSWLINGYLWLGGRSAMVRASVSVRRGVLVGKEIDGYISGVCGRDEGVLFCRTMIGQARTEARLSQARTGMPRIVDLRHPEYTFFSPGGCTGCIEAGVIFSAYANSSDVRRLTDINFGCITRWKPCESEQDILPTAWAQVQREGPPPPQVASCSETVRALTRDLGCVPLATVTGVTDTGEGLQLKIRWENECALDMLENQNTLAGLNREPWIRQGDRLLVFEGQLFYTSEPCGLVPATEENLKAAQKGVSETFYDPPPPFVLPVGSIKPSSSRRPLTAPPCRSFSPGCSIDI